MTTEEHHPSRPPDGGPLQDFSDCHVGILEHFERLRRLPELSTQADAAEQVRQIAGELDRFFRAVVLEHHAEEEQELFTAVMQSAASGAEAEQAQLQIDSLTRDHRRLEGLWQQIEGDIQRLAKGKPATLNAEVVAQLADGYLAHARFEESEFLPLSARILSKNDQSALGLSLHMRHLEPGLRPSLGIVPKADFPAVWSKVLRVTLGGVAAVLLLAMMLVTSVDVIGRYVFNSPLIGAFELTELMLAALIFIGLPLATERDEHITVDLLDAFLPHGVILSQTMAMSALSAVVLAGLGWQLWLKATSLVEDGSITNTLEVPLAPVGYLMALSCVLTAVILLVQSVLAARTIWRNSLNTDSHAGGTQ